MTRRWFSSLRVRLSLLVVAAVIPCASLVLYDAFEQQRNAIAALSPYPSVTTVAEPSGIRGRAIMSGGWLTIDSSAGTVLTAELPLSNRR